MGEIMKLYQLKAIYHIEADSEEKAYELFKNGKVKPVIHEIFRVRDIKDPKS